MFTEYRKYSLREIRAALASFGQVEDACSGEFLVAAGACACLVAPVRDATKTHFPQPSKLHWVPPAWHDDPHDESPWFPTNVRHLFIDKQVPRYLFVQVEKTNVNYLYVGTIAIADYGDTYLGLKSAVFHVCPKLPRPVWSPIGLFGEWAISINGKLHDVTSHSLLQEQLQAIRQVAVAEVIVTRYEEDVLILLINNAESVLYSYDAALRNGRVAINDKSIESDGFHDFYMANEESIRVSSTHVMSIHQACQIIESFHESGKLPGWINWSAC